MLKVAIWPSFLNKSLFEIKEDDGAWTLLLTKESHEHLQDRGSIWSQRIAAAKATQLVTLAQAVFESPYPDNRLILDGVSATLRLRSEVGEIKHTFREPLPGSNESAFMAQLLALAESSIPEKECQDYLELLAPYFFDRSPIKEFAEDGYRLKIIGHLTSSDLEALQVKLQGLKEYEAPVLDMSNFMGTGRGLDPCFLAIRELRGLRIWVNAQAQNYLLEIGFDHPHITLV